MNHKYTATFEAQGRLYPQPEQEKETFASVCTASDLSGLKRMFPSKTEAKLNKDLCYLVFNGAVVNEANKNSDGITSAGAVALARTMKFKQLNIEHDRERVIGCLTGVSFSRIDTNEEMSEEEALAETGPFNLSCSAVVWRIITDVDTILEECSTPLSDHYMSVSTSWEVGFNEYGVAVGDTIFNKASLKFGDDAEGYVKYLRGEGGKGVTASGIPVSRVIENGYTLGFAITTNPAARVKGVLTMDLEENEIAATVEDQEKIIVLEVKTEQEIAAEKKVENNENKISTFEKHIVNKIKQPMKYKNLDELFEALASETPPTAQECKAFVEKAMLDGNEKYVAEKDAKAKAEADLKQAVADAQASRVELDNLKFEVSEMKAEMAEREAQDILDGRFSSLAETFNLEDQKLRKLITKSIKDLDEDGFAHWLENDGAVILAGKEKEKAPVDVKEVTEAIKEAKASVEDIPNAQDIEDKTPKALSASDIELSF